MVEELFQFSELHQLVERKRTDQRVRSEGRAEGRKSLNLKSSEMGMPCQ